MAVPLLPLTLSVKCENWRMNDGASAEADAEFRRVRGRAIERDQYTCRFCGFRSQKWQEVHHVNDDHADNRLENLITTCPFCHQCQHIGLAGRNKEAVLVWLPEIPQATLHHVVRTAMVAVRVSEQQAKDPKSRADVVRATREAADVAKTVLATLRSREAAAERLIGTSDPLEVGNAMLLLPDPAYARRGERLAGIRLLPLGRRMHERQDIMVKHVDAWIEAGGPYANLKPSSWAMLLKSIVA